MYIYLQRIYSSVVSVCKSSLESVCYVCTAVLFCEKVYIESKPEEEEEEAGRIIPEEVYTTFVGQSM